MYWFCQVEKEEKNTQVKNQFKPKLDFQSKQIQIHTLMTDLDEDISGPRPLGTAAHTSTGEKFKYEFGKKVWRGVNILYGSRLRLAGFSPH